MNTPIRLRAHQVLCLLGFRGRGYSPGFIQAMADVQARLRTDPRQEVELVTEPDVLCAACPKLATSGCTLGGPDHEAHMRAHDAEVLRRLELGAGAVLTWETVLARIRGAVRGRDLPAICTTCPWLPLGVCAVSVDDLRTAP